MLLPLAVQRQFVNVGYAVIDLYTLVMMSLNENGARHGGKWVARRRRTTFEFSNLRMLLVAAAALSPPAAIAKVVAAIGRMHSTFAWLFRSKW
mmetsp:Transcript_27651/g.84290  ORF Transcript_27651/g.84290 Transcript_27651/m.84290 type:complete len:93 (-) Transcript_27651:381-659(-)|eukprot:scaffold11044_cov30-Tisochrysis_lutea.AAC.5